MPPLSQSQLEKLPSGVLEQITEKDIKECYRIRVECAEHNYESGNFQKYRLSGSGEDELWFVDIPGALRIGEDIGNNYNRREKI